MTMSAIEMRLAQIEQMQMTVMEEVTNFGATLPGQLETFNEAIDMASESITNISDELAQDTMQLETLSETAVATEASATLVTEESAMVEEALAKTEIKSDFYWIQDSERMGYAPLELTTQQDWNQIPTGCFTVNTMGFENNVIVEFFLSATINPSADLVQASKIRLNKDGMPAALAVSSDNEMEGENHTTNFSVFYKVVQEPDTEAAYDIEIFQTGPADPLAVSPANIVFDDMTNDRGLMWGYKVYATELASVDEVPACE